MAKDVRLILENTPNGYLKIIVGCQNRNLLLGYLGDGEPEKTTMMWNDRLRNQEELIRH